MALHQPLRALQRVAPRHKGLPLAHQVFLQLARLLGRALGLRLVPLEPLPLELRCTWWAGGWRRGSTPC